MKPHSLWSNSDLLIRKPEYFYAERQPFEGASTTKAIFYRGEHYKGKPSLNFAYIGFPEGEVPYGGFPAVVLAHGGGGASFHNWVEHWTSKGFAAIAPDFYAHQYGDIDEGDARINPQGVVDCPAGSISDTRLTYADSWTYHAVSDVILCRKILIDSGKVDPDKIGLVGISWGSVVTCITSGVDDGFAAFGVVYGGGYIYKTKTFFKEPCGNESEWADCYDPSSYLPYNTKPTLFTTGADDDCFSVVYNQKSWELARGDKYFAYKQSLFHDHRWRDDDKMFHVTAFMNYILKGEEMPFRVTEEKISGDLLSLNVKNSQNVREAKLVYTTVPISALYSRNDKWESLSATISEGKFVAKVPSEATAFFMQFSDKKPIEFIQSGEMHFFCDIIVDIKGEL